jgi:hypothetical protein
MLQHKGTSEQDKGGRGGGRARQGTTSRKAEGAAGQQAVSGEEGSPATFQESAGAEAHRGHRLKPRAASDPAAAAQGKRSSSGMGAEAPEVSCTSRSMRGWRTVQNATGMGVRDASS